jgi:DNA-binding NarL/FixJ family response regulator
MTSGSRERELLELIAQGWSNARIAAHLTLGAIVRVRQAGPGGS